MIDDDPGRRRDAGGRSRKRFAALTLVAALATACTGGPPNDSGRVEPPPATPDTRPDIILVNLDDADLSLIGHEPILEYFPNIAALIEQPGLRFDQFYAAAPLCAPSRASMLRGQYPHNTEVFLNFPGPDNNGAVGSFQAYWERGYPEDDLSVWLDDAGYFTALVGKYLHSEFPRATGSNGYIPPGWDDFRASNGNKYFETYQSRNGEFGPLDAGVFRTDDEADSAVEIIEEHAAGEALFLYVAPYNPHGGVPQIYAPRHAEAFSDVSFERTPDYDEADMGDKPSFYAALPPLTDEEVARFDADHVDRLRSLLSVDEMIGRIFEALEQAGTLDDTYVLFTSDNGFQLGQHRMVAKQAFYERSSRVGLVVRGPGVEPGRSDALLVHIDLNPTILDLAGVPVPDLVDGRSFAPLLRGDDLADRPAGILIENRETQTTRGVEVPQDYVALRRGDSIYIEHASGEREFYDLSNDPYQLDNGYETLDQAERDELAAALDALRHCSGEACIEPDAEG